MNFEVHIHVMSFLARQAVKLWGMVDRASLSSCLRCMQAELLEACLTCCCMDCMDWSHSSHGKEKYITNLCAVMTVKTDRPVCNLVPHCQTETDK